MNEIEFSDADLKLYGLRDGNPYERQPVALTGGDARVRWLSFVGTPSDRLICGHVQRAEQTGTSAAFLISGRSATGRTTLGNRIAHLYWDCQGQRPSKVIRVRCKARNHNSAERVYEMLKDLRNQVTRATRGWAGPESPLIELVPDGFQPDLSPFDLQRRAEGLADRMAVRPASALGLEIIVDGVQGADFMEVMAKTFVNVKAVVVVTRDDYDNADTVSREQLEKEGEWKEWALPLTLKPLSGGDVEMLAATRWEHHAPGLECPFEPGGVRAAFETRDEPTGRALDWLSWLLRGRLDSYDGADCWPEARELGIPEQWIKQEIRRAETAPRGGAGGARGV